MKKHFKTYLKLMEKLQNSIIKLKLPFNFYQFFNLLFRPSIQMIFLFENGTFKSITFEL